MSFHTDFADWLVGSFRLPVRVRSLARTEGAASPNSSRKGSFHSQEVGPVSLFRYVNIVVLF